MEEIAQELASLHAFQELLQIVVPEYVLVHVNHLYMELVQAIVANLNAHLILTEEIAQELVIANVHLDNLLIIQLNSACLLVLRLLMQIIYQVHV